MEPKEVFDWLSKQIEEHFGQSGATAFAVLVAMLAVAYIAMLVFSRVLEVRKHLSTRRALLEEEKLTAEIQKIRYEIAALRKHNDLPEIAVPERAAALGGAVHHVVPPVAPSRLPSFSFSAGITQMAALLGRPERGLSRALWSLKMLGLPIAAAIVGAVLIMVFVPSSVTDQKSMVGADFILLSMLPMAYFLIGALVNLVRGLLAPRPKPAT